METPIFSKPVPHSLNNSVPALDRLHELLRSYQELRLRLLNISESFQDQNVDDQYRAPVFLPITEVALLPGKFVEPPGKEKITVHLGAEFFAEMSVCQSINLLDRKISGVQKQISVVQAATGRQQTAHIESSKAENTSSEQQTAPIQESTPRSVAAEPQSANACSEQPGQAGLNPVNLNIEREIEKINREIEAVKLENQELRQQMQVIPELLTFQSEIPKLNKEIEELKHENKGLRQDLQHQKELSKKQNKKEIVELSSDILKVLQKHGHCQAEEASQIKELKATMQMYRSELMATHDRIRDLEETNTSLHKQLKAATSKLKEAKRHTMQKCEHKGLKKVPDSNYTKEANTKSESSTVKESQSEQPTSDTLDAQKFEESGLPFVEIEEFYDNNGVEISSRAIDLGQELKKVQTALKKPEENPIPPVPGSHVNIPEEANESSLEFSSTRTEDEDAKLLEALMRKEEEQFEDERTARNRGLVSKQWNKGFLNKASKAAKPKTGQEITVKKHVQRDANKNNGAIASSRSSHTADIDSQPNTGILKNSTDPKPLSEQKTVHFNLDADEYSQSVPAESKQVQSVDHSAAFSGMVVERSTRVSAGSSKQVSAVEQQVEEDAPMPVQNKVSRFKAARRMQQMPTI